MRLARGIGPHATSLCFFAVGLYLTAATSSTAHGQELDVFFDGLAAGDTILARSTLQEGLETRRSQEVAQWRNDTTGNSGTVTPLRTFRIKTGFFCRDFRETLVTAGYPAERIGTACRREDGIWIRVER
jgi:surface antigen